MLLSQLYTSKVVSKNNTSDIEYFMKKSVFEKFHATVIFIKE